MNTQKAIIWSGEQANIFAWFAMSALVEFRNLIVCAYAGVGKTSTIIQAFKHAKESKILYAVFGKRNQLDAEKKIFDKRVTVKTLHAVGYGIIAKYWGRIKVDGYCEWSRVETIAPELSAKKYITANIARLISLAKNLYVGVPSLEDMTKLANEKDIATNEKDQAAGWTTDKLVGIAMQAMEASKVRSFNISFDDMVWLPVTLGIVKAEYPLVVIDEMQDMNVNQLTMATGLVLPDGRFCGVGDSKQAIYGFRGALQNAMAFFRDKLQAGELKLTQTFRCPKAVVREANPFVPDYVAHESNGEGEVLDKGSDYMEANARVGDFILSRTNAPLMRAALAFIRKGKTAKIEGKDIAKALGSVIDQVNAPDINAFADRLAIWEQVGISKATGRNATQRIETLQDQAETLRVLSEVSSSLDDMRARLENLFQDSASGYAKPAIILSTVHKAKGLEAETVYLLEETFTRGRATTEEEQAEEKNIRYVAITRAQKTLIKVRQSPKP